MAVTIKDIAKVLGVTPTAVSKALNNKPDVGMALKEKVRKVAKEMGYKQNTIAKRLVTRRSFTLGLFLLTRYKLQDDDNFGYKFFDGIIEEANNRGYDLVLFSVDSNKFLNKGYMELCSERQVEGAIFIGLGAEDKNLEKIAESDIPVALIDSFVDGDQVSTISTDNEKSIEVGMEYLWKLGHRKIAMIIGHEEAFVSEARYKAYKNFLLNKEHFDSQFTYKGDFTVEGGYLAAKEILNKKDLPTAVFCESDSMAIGAVKAFKEAGVNIPEDISIIGFDNLKMGAYTDPSLTTMAQSPLKMGSMAAKIVIDQIEKKGDALNIMIKPKLIERKSCSKKNSNND